ncbi:unnamed protein product [Blepharisma stoltei]|uniref:Uncharacterized protein n=1 Tax=Blepharisma stoltei TaxID=1481888 RepID=A0AAU9J6H6_9CILI|nr:unnamed protein product [Blepharisma stoltei]
MKIIILLYLLSTIFAIRRSVNPEIFLQFKHTGKLENIDQNNQQSNAIFLENKDKLDNNVKNDLSTSLFNIENTQDELDTNFMQLSNDDSGEDNDGLEDDTKILLVFILNAITCVFCCAFLQFILMLSKRMSNELSELKKNYRQHQGFLRFKEFRKAWAKENEASEAEN